MRKLRKILLSTIFALTVSTTFFANTAGTQTVTAASGTAVTFKRKVIAYRTGSVYNFVPIGNAADNRRALNLLMEGNEKKVININNNIHIDTYISSFFHANNLLCFLCTVRKFSLRFKLHTGSAGRT